MSNVPPSQPIPDAPSSDRPDNHPQKRPVTSPAPHELWRGVHETLRTDAAGGALLLAATAVAVVLANTPAAAGYVAVRDFTFGPELLHLHLSVGAWAADGLLGHLLLRRRIGAEGTVRRRQAPQPTCGRSADRRRGRRCGRPALIFVAVNAGAGPMPCAAGPSRPRRISRSRSP